MWPVLLDLGAVRVTVFGLALATSFTLGSFVFWRRLREDFDSEQLLTLWLWLVVAAWVGSGVWVWWSTSWRQIWGALLLPLLVMVWWSRHYKWDFWELLDTWGPVSLTSAVLGFGGWGPAGWRAAVVAAMGVVVVSIVRRVYRGWRWYTSGRVGLPGVISLAWWGIINLAIANFNRWAVYSWGWVTVVTAVVIYLRSGRKIWQK